MEAGDTIEQYILVPSLADGNAIKILCRDDIPIICIQSVETQTCLPPHTHQTPAASTGAVPRFDAVYFFTFLIAVPCTINFVIVYSSVPSCAPSRP